jgi:hypothetical protein
MNDNNEIMGPSSSPATNELTKALAQAQAEYPVVAYDSANPHFKSKFASYAQCCDSLRGPLTKHGLALPDFRPGLLGGQWVMLGTLRHSSGQWITGIAPLLMGKSDMQSFGAACTYAKRTLLMALCGGFSGEPDDDGASVVSAAHRPAQAEAVKELQYEASAKKAIVEAADVAAAQKHLDTVRLRAKERAITPDVYRRCEAEFNRKWKQQEA